MEKQFSYELHIISYVMRKGDVCGYLTKLNVESLSGERYNPSFSVELRPGSGNDR